MSSGWKRASRMLATVAVTVTAALNVGCGLSPAYEPEPRVPVGYVAANPEPATSEELAARAGGAQPGEVAVGQDEDEYADTDPSALTEFKPALEGHGQWVEDPTYGTLWVPAATEVGPDFTPYVTAGHWSYDDSTSWVWVSDYSWGWAPFHYGRWVHVGRHGWAWIPGRTYAGAWVTWRTGGPSYGYVGWAPMAPSWYWYGGYPVGWNFGYSPYYVYCHNSRIYDGGVGRHVVRPSDPQAREIEARTQPFTPANPSVGGGDRVAATPTVGGARAAAAPTVGGARAAASPTVGPRPTEVGIESAKIVPPPADNAGLARAKAFAAPRTAVAQGATPPAGALRRPHDQDGLATPPAQAYGRGYDNRSPVTTSRIDAATRAPQVQGVAPVPPRQSAYADPRPEPRALSPGYASPAPGAVTQAPAYRSSPSISSGPPPSYRHSPSVSSPTFRSSPSVSSSPSFRSSPSVSSSPSFRSSPSVSSSPSFRSSPSVSSSPSFRSSPSVSRPSMPSRSASPSVRSRR